jgi:uncharacterized membrane protein
MDKIAENVMEMPFLTGFIFFFVALITYYHPPKKINSLYGYRTPSSMKNQERWDFAQRFSSLRMIEGGLFLIFFSFLKLAFPFLVDIEMTISITALFLVVIYLLLTTELALKKNFPNQ